MIPTVRLNTSPAPNNIAVVRTQAPDNQTTCIETPVHMNPCTPVHRIQTPEHQFTCPSVPDNMPRVRTVTTQTSEVH